MMHYYESPAARAIRRRKELANTRRLMTSGVWRFESRVGRYDGLIAIYAQPIKKRRMGFIFLEGEPVKPHHFIVTEEEEGYLVSALKAPNQNKDSYVEVLLRPDHPMYERIQGSVSMLNIAGIQTEVEGVGESFQAGVYHVIVNDAEHAELIGSVK